jgi:hypothetical protein
MHVSEREPCLVGEIPLEEPMSANDLQREPLTGRSQVELLAVGDNELLSLHASDETDDRGRRQAQGAGKGRECRVASAILLFTQMLQGVFEALPIAVGSPPPPQSESGEGRDKYEKKQ